MEKAWAKIFGSYERIESGTCREALRDLTGAPTKTFFNKDDNTGGYNAEILTNLKDALLLNNYIVTASAEEEDNLT